MGNMLALQVAVSGMMAQEQRTEVVANNIANLDTTGFQRRRVGFNDLIYRHFRRPNSISSQIGDKIPAGVSTGLGVKTASIYRVQEQGALQSTSNSFDLAIQGAGFFQVLLPNGDTAFTRNGTFQLNEEGQLVTSDGFVVQPGISVSAAARQVTINSGGEVLATLDGQDAPSNAGTIQIATFLNSGGLQAKGDSLFLATTKSGAASATNPGQDGAGLVLQGFVEKSNVNAVQEIANLIKAQRAYEMNSKMVSTVDQMMKIRS